LKKRAAMEIADGFYASTAAPYERCFGKLSSPIPAARDFARAAMGVPDEALLSTAAPRGEYDGRVCQPIQPGKLCLITYERKQTQAAWLESSRPST
jgi:hypothetical protein